ncbi:MAG: type III secretion system export apparatus subunit SctV [Deltaproteobacteria bacterium]|jgi:type III secretion protein V|nr:type III secretion system export apparatus subunit SctV [Deltaproteobacteria bacterium]
MSFISPRSLVDKVIRHTDLLMVFVLVMVFAMMIVPMPTPVVDLLIGINIGMSFIVLMMAMYVASALEFSIFPTILLFTTLFRVGLNITTTRLILLNADAGAIIDTFGEFMVGGNFIVGGVVFLILTVVQFIVISKGSERVAEVGARFTLDAMPGKQMSIDADLRAGAIDMEEAKRRRDRVSNESSLYGAMDGAMKFVKGDAVAGIFITSINLVGGIVIGITQMDMSAGEAVQRFGVLSIGDGLVSQIPSLLISISAGILITRTGGESADGLGSQVGGQIFSQPKALALAGSLVAIMAVIPGFPKPQLIMLGACICGVGFVLLRLKREAASPSAQEAGREELNKTLASATGSAKASRAKPGEDFAPTVPILLDVSTEMGASLSYDALNEELLSLRRALYFDLGVPFPGINLRGNAALPGLSYALLIHEVPVARGTLEKGMLLAREAAANLEMLSLEVRETEQFLPGVPSVWVDGSKEALLTQAGIGCMSHPRILAYHLSLMLTRHAAEFIGLQQSKFLLDRMEAMAPDLVREATRLLPAQKIAEIFQRLVRERISIRNLSAILEALVDWAAREKDIVLLTEQVRVALKRQISYMYSGGMNILPVVLLQPDVEDLVRKAIRQTSSGAYLALAPEHSSALIAALHRETDAAMNRKQIPALLTSMDIRRYVRRLIEPEFYDLPVLSYQELTPEITTQPIARIKL